MNHSLLVRLGMLSFLLFGMLTPHRALALSEPFNPVAFISDDEFNDTYVMTCDGIQDFLNGRTGILKSFGENGKTAAQVICQQANHFGINPRILLVLIQKEQGLLGDSQPNATQFSWAAGCAPGWNESRGFSNQIECAARTLRNRYNNASLGEVVDGIVPTNRATLALIKYNNNQKGLADFYRIWTRYWPQSTATAIPTEIHVAASNLETTPAVKEPCRSGWLVGDKGLQGYHLVTPNAAGIGDSTNSAIWRPNIPRDGVYQVFAYVPDRAAMPWPCGSYDITWDTSHARYSIRHRDGTTTYEVNQAPLHNEWVNLGNYYFNKGTDGYLMLSDQTGEPSMSRYVSFDEAKFVWVAP